SSILFSFTTPPPTLRRTLALHDALPILAQQDGQQAVGEHLLFAVALVQAKADDGVGRPHRHQRDEQVGALAQQLRDAHALHIPRSEAHTSELRSRFDLVCRLLLAKKKTS